MAVTLDFMPSRQDRIEQLIAKWPRIDIAPHKDIDALFDELLSLDPSTRDLERALIGSIMTAHMLANTLQRLAAIEKYLYRLYLERGR